MQRVDARVVVLCGPPGVGKTWLSAQSGFPVLRLDDFFKDGDDPSLPRTAAGEVDWDSPGSWDRDRALAAVQDLCRTGKIDAPIYDMSKDRSVGSRAVDIGSAPVFIADGFFAAELIPDLTERDLLAAAIVLRRSPSATMVRRTIRDLRENRKSPATVVSRSLRLFKRDRSIVSELVTRGASPMGMREARTLLAGLTSRVVEQPPVPPKFP